MKKGFRFEKKKDKHYWLKNDLYHLHFKDVEILGSSTAWLHDRIMDATEKLICKELRTDDNYQSVENVQKRRGAPCREVKNEHIHLLHVGSENRLLTFCSNVILICDSLKMPLSRVNRKCFHPLCKSCVKELIANFLLSQKQTYGYNSGPFAIVFAAEILDGKSSLATCFDVQRMRGYLINCLENKVLVPFLKVWSHLYA